MLPIYPINQSVNETVWNGSCILGFTQESVRKESKVQIIMMLSDPAGWYIIEFLQVSSVSSWVPTEMI